MTHKYLKFSKEEAIIDRVNNAKFLLKCPICEKEHGSSMEISLLPDILYCWGTPTHEDWKNYKKTRKLTNNDIANLLGMKTESVKTMTQPNKELPKWAISMLFEYYKNK